MGGDGGGDLIIRRGGGAGAGDLERGIGLVAGGLAGQVGQGDAADHAAFDMGGEVLLLLFMAEARGGGAVRDQKVIGGGGRNVFADNQSPGDVLGCGIAVQRQLSGGDEGRQGAAQVDAKVGAEAFDGTDAGGLVGIEAEGQQAFEAVFLGFELRVGFGVDGGSERSEAGGVGVFGDGVEGSGAFGAFGVGQG